MHQNDGNERRDHVRVRISVPVQIETDAANGPIRGSTSDLSLGGCYIETIFPLPTGTHLDLQMFIGTTLVIAATVVTCDPQVGNGIKFTRMLPEDRDALEAFLESARQTHTSSSLAASTS